MDRSAKDWLKTGVFVSVLSTGIKVYAGPLEEAWQSEAESTASSESPKELWVSLYSGAERSFPKALRLRVVETLKALGVTFQVNVEDGTILVEASSRATVQNLLGRTKPAAR